MAIKRVELKFTDGSVCLVPLEETDEVTYRSGGFGTVERYARLYRSGRISRLVRRLLGSKIWYALMFKRITMTSIMAPRLSIGTHERANALLAYQDLTPESRTTTFLALGFSDTDSILMNASFEVFDRNYWVLNLGEEKDKAVFESYKAKYKNVFGVDAVIATKDCSIKS